MVHHRGPHTHLAPVYCSQSIHRHVFWEIEGNWRTQGKPLWVWEEHTQLLTEPHRNPSAGLNLLACEIWDAGATCYTPVLTVMYEKAVSAPGQCQCWAGESLRLDLCLNILPGVSSIDGGTSSVLQHQSNHTHTHTLTSTRWRWTKSGAAWSPSHPVWWSLVGWGRTLEQCFLSKLTFLQEHAG